MVLINESYRVLVCFLCVCVLDPWLCFVYAVSLHGWTYLLCYSDWYCGVASCGCLYESLKLILKGRELCLDILL